MKCLSQKFFNPFFYVKKLKDFFIKLNINYFGYLDIKSYDLDYDKYWQIRPSDNRIEILNSFRLFRAQYCINSISRSSKLLDLGSGDGKFIDYFQMKRKDIKFILSDFTTEICNKLAIKGYEVIHLDLRDITSLHKLEKYDYITAFEVFEHLPEPEITIKYLMEHIEKGLIFSVPNSGHYTYRIRLLLGRFPMQWRHHPGEHLRFWTLNDMQWWLEKYMRINKNNFKIIPYRATFSLFNKILPNLFSKGILVHVKK